MVRKNKKRKASKARRLHRTLGVGAALFVVFMVLSGLVINHSNGLGLDQRHVSHSFLLGWYGLGGPDNIESFAVGNDWLSFAGSQIYLNEKFVASTSGGIGAVTTGELVIAAASDEILLFDDDGNVVERLPWRSIASAPIESVGLHANSIVAVQSAGQIWLADAALLNWRQDTEASTNPRWSHAEPSPEELQQSITKQYRGDGPTMERVLLDLHSGRIFGPVGVLVYDLLALALGFLSISGLLLWFRGRRNGKRK